MKISSKKYSNLLTLIVAIAFLILGAFMYKNPDAVIIYTTYVIGGLLIIIGIFKCFKNYLDVKKDNSTNSKEMIVGIIMAVVGLICIFLAGAIETLVRFIIGGWILFSGINRFINVLYLEKKDSFFWISLVIAALLIGGGLYTILEVNLAFKLLGIVIIVYAILEIIGYIFNIKSSVLVKETDTNQKVIDAKLIEKK